MKNSVDPNQQTRHHRKPRCQGGDNGDNVILVSRKCHEAYHLLFNEGDPHHIAKVLNETWIDPSVELVVMKRK